MKIKYLCLYCGAENFTNEVTSQEDYCKCVECGGLHDIEIEDDGEVIVNEF